MICLARRYGFGGRYHGAGWFFDTSYVFIYLQFIFSLAISLVNFHGKRKTILVSGW